MSDTIPTLLLLSLAVFFLMRLVPGDPILTLLGTEGPGDPLQREILERELGLDRPLPVQYVAWLADVAKGDWGQSISSRVPVSDLLKARLAVTLHLATIAWVTSLVLGIAIGTLAALRRNSWSDVVISVASLSGVAIPNFLLGLLLIYFFAVRLHWLPATGFVSIADDPVASLQHLVLPVVALSTGLMASIIRQTRSAMLEVMNQDYIRTARAKGLRPRAVVLRHALKNAMIPIVTVAALQIRLVISGTIIVETMFAIPGMGRLTITAVQASDYLVIQMVVMLVGVFAVSASLLADIAYSQLDPRIRLG